MNSFTFDSSINPSSKVLTILHATIIPAGSFNKISIISSFAIRSIPLQQLNYIDNSQIPA
ncbi:hypothetical protein MBAV_005044 [Candidatus Magnetobacterium bavaricum]|uniref:Uncharacterized protein n=1 Tax=Candidatus Magnetobacterium bavaricum TaxID=29290 RepID=A0A0F3GQ36_9BACT|nr:hypothetical protein MBAV_005044 [Candidatus Magnetobacterium bavaricum]